MRLTGPLRLLSLLIALIGSSLTVSAPAAAAARTQLSASDALYPRLVRLSHNTDTAKNGTVIASVTTFPGGGGSGQEDIYASADNGASFSRIGMIKDAAFAKGLCCGTLYELPQQIGALKAGTLLWAGSVGGDTPTEPMRIMIFDSTNLGQTWSYLSDCQAASVPRSAGGLWEPQFSVAADGKLICYFSDETVAGHSQLIAQVSSSDGITWSAKKFTIASTIKADRPGMAVVTKLPNGHYFMTFELCGPAACTVFAKTSTNGSDWGDPGNVGARVQTADKQFFFHAPTNVWVPDAKSANGKLIVVGQVFMNANGVDPGNGRTLLVNSNADGTGNWTTLAAPVAITSPPGPGGNPCQNYSSALLPSTDGSTLLEMANDYANGTSGGCHAYFATASLVASRGQIGIAASNFTVNGNQPGTMTVTIKSIAGYTGTAALAVSVPGLPGSVTIDPEHVTLNADGSVTATVKVTPGAASASASTSGTVTAMLSGLSGHGFGIAALGGGTTALLMLFGAGAIMKQSVALVARIALLAMLAALAGCGGDSGSSGGGTTHTVQTYQGTVSAADTLDPSLGAQTSFKVTLKS